MLGPKFIPVFDFGCVQKKNKKVVDEGSEKKNNNEAVAANEQQKEENSGKGNQKSEAGEKKENNGGGGGNAVLMKTDLHCEGCAGKVVKFVRAFPGITTTLLRPRFFFFCSINALFQLFLPLFFVFLFVHAWVC